MPSQAVDAAWHEFILMTREYQSFCDEAFGYYLHHTPEQALGEPMPAALQRTLLATDRQPSYAGYAGIPFLFAAGLAARPGGWPDLDPRGPRPAALPGV